MSDSVIVVSPTEPTVEVVVRAKDGRTFNLGNPKSVWFPLRRAWYLWRRRKELANG